MAKSIFRDKGVRPDDEVVGVAVEAAKPLWNDCVDFVSGAYPGFAQEWKYYGAAWGWSAVLKSKTKTLCYLTPAEGYFQVSIIFNDKGRLLAVGAGLPEQVAQGVEDSKNNAKNIPFDFDVRQQADLEIAKKLIAARAGS